MGTKGSVKGIGVIVKKFPTGNIAFTVHGDEHGTSQVGFSDSPGHREAIQFIGSMVRDLISMPGQAAGMAARQAADQVRSKAIAKGGQQGF